MTEPWLDQALKESNSSVPWLRKNFNFPKKYLYTILSSFEMKMLNFFPENFAERVVIIDNCPKGR